jgi:hypothetical protein
MNILKAIETALKKKAERNYDYLYWCIDLHGVILSPTYTLINEGAYFYPYAKDTLRLLSKNSENKLILWTSSYSSVINGLLTTFKEDGINFAYVNENPDFLQSHICDFTKKWFFDILLDDKAGFEAEKDWKDIYNFLKANYGN